MLKNSAWLKSIKKYCRKYLQNANTSCTVKLRYNEHALDRPILFVTAVIRYNHYSSCSK